MLGSLPNEILLEILSYLDYYDSSDVSTLTNLRLCSSHARDIVNATLRGKLVFRLGRSVGATQRRTQTFLAPRSAISEPAPFKSCFSAVAFDWQILTRAGSDDWKRGRLSSNAIDVITAAVPFLQNIGPQLSGIKVFSRAGPCEKVKCQTDSSFATWNKIGKCEAECNSVHELQDRFFKAVSLSLMYASRRGFLDNVRSFSIDTGCGHYLSHFMECIDDPALEKRLDKLCCPGAAGGKSSASVIDALRTHSMPKYLKETYLRDHDPRIIISWGKYKSPPRLRIPLFDQIEELNLWNKIENLHDRHGHTRVDPRGQRIDRFIQHMPVLQTLRYDAVEPSPWFDAGPIPWGELRSFTGLNFANLRPCDNFFHACREELTRLHLVNCNVGTLSWLQLDSGRIDQHHMSDDFTIAKFLDSLIPALPNLETLRLEGLGYVWHYAPWRSDQPPFQPWNPSYPSIPGAKFKRPIVTPFLEDIRAFTDIKDGYANRRAERGLPVDPWSTFLNEFQSEVHRMFTSAEIRTFGGELF